MVYDFSKINFSKFKLKFKDPFNPRDLIPTDIDLPAAGKSYDCESNLSTVLTQLARYSKERNINLSPKWYSIQYALQEKFRSRFLKRDPTRVTNYHLAKHLNPVIDKIRKNGGCFKELNLLLSNYNESFSIRFFLKSIQKVVLAKSLDADKPGQGISAWSPQLNAVYCAVFRAIEECFKSDLKDNVIYDNGISETDLDFRISQLWDHDAKIFTSDCKEFDANQDASTQFLEDTMASMYLPIEILRLYRQMRLKSKQRSKFVTLTKETVKDSGESATLLTNTTVKMFHTLLTTDVKGVHVETYKGDDGCINADEIELTNLLVKLDPELHLPIIADMDFPLHGDMGGWFYSSFGIIPDILKLVAKFISKDFSKKSTLTPWEKQKYGVETLSYFEQVKLSLVDKEKFLNEKKIIYLQRIYRDVYGMEATAFVQLISYFYFLQGNDYEPSDLKYFNAIYFSDSGYQREDLTEADKNRKRIVQTYKNVQDIKI